MEELVVQAEIQKVLLMMMLEVVEVAAEEEMVE